MKIYKTLFVICLVALVFLGAWFAVYRHKVKKSVNFIYDEANVNISQGRDLDAGYLVTQSLINQFRFLPREDVCEALRKASDKFKESGDERYLTTIRRLRENLRLIGKLSWDSIKEDPPRDSSDD